MVSKSVLWSFAGLRIDGSSVKYICVSGTATGFSRKNLTHSQIKLRIANIIPSVSRLHSHLLSFENGAREGKLVARATVRTASADSYKAIR